MDDIDRMVIKEEEMLDAELAAGEISEEAYRMELKYIHDNARAAIEERAQEAYDNVMGEW